MIVSGEVIHQLITAGGGELGSPWEGCKLVIAPYDHKNIGPNSYDVHLADELLVYKTGTYGVLRHPPLDMKRDNPHDILTIPEEGLVLQPGTLYLGRTVEYTETEGLVPMLEGRSSAGRLGLSIHITAGFGDVGFKGHWTLEMTVVHPLRVYSGVSVAQIYYYQVSKPYTSYGEDFVRGAKYQNAHRVQSSQYYTELQ